MGASTLPEARIGPRLRPSTLIAADLLEPLAREGHVRSVTEMIDALAANGFLQLAPLLHPFRDHPAPLSLIVNHFRTRIVLDAYVTWDWLQQRLAGSRLGIILPLPPHFVHLLSPFVSDVLLRDEGEPSPAGLAHRPCSYYCGFRPCRRAAGELEALAFEAYPHAAGLYVEPHVADVLDAMGSAPALLLGHVRPHPVHDDVLIDPAYPVTLL